MLSSHKFRKYRSAIGTLDWGPDFDVALGQHRPVLVMDNRNVGESTLAKDREEDLMDFSLDDLADDVVKLKKELAK